MQIFSNRAASAAPSLRLTMTRRVRAEVVSLLVCAACLGMGVARAQQPSFTNLADTGTAIPNGGGATYTGFGTVSISGSNVAFMANSYDGSTNLNGIYQTAIGSSTVSTVADTTTAAPGHGGLTLGTFTAFDSTNLSISGTNVVFKATVDNNVNGIFPSQNGILTDVINVNDSLFGSTVSSFTLAPHALEGGKVVFTYGLADRRFGVAEYGFATVVPEPATWVLGVAAVAVTRHRQMHGLSQNPRNNLA